MKLFVDTMIKAQKPSSSRYFQVIFNVNKPYKFTYSTPNLEVHNGELTSLRGMGDRPLPLTQEVITDLEIKASNGGKLLCLGPQFVALVIPLLGDFSSWNLKKSVAANVNHGAEV